MNSKKMRKNGYTLVELIAAIAAITVGTGVFVIMVLVIIWLCKVI